MLRAGDAFQLGYLQHHFHAHFAAAEMLEPLRGAGGNLGERAARMLASLPERGPEIMSCLFQLENIVGNRLQVTPPQPPQSAADCARFAQAIDAAFEGSKPGDDERIAFRLGDRVGNAEAWLAIAVKAFSLAVAAPADARVADRLHTARAAMQAAAAARAVETTCPTMRREHAALGRWLGAAIEAAARTPEDPRILELAQFALQLSGCARSLEAAAWGTPRASVRAWREERLSGALLMRRLCEHHRFSTPCTTDAQGRPDPKVFEFDKRVLFLFSDPETIEQRPDLLRAETQYLTAPGAFLLGGLNDGVDLVVIDPMGNDPSNPLTINYPRHLHATLKQVAHEVSFELGACDWTRLELPPFRTYPFWLQNGPGGPQNFVVRDGYGRARVAVFTSEAALETHIAAHASPEQAKSYVRDLRFVMSGDALFAALAKLPIDGLILNPSGPGRTRAFNRKTLEMLAQERTV